MSMVKGKTAISFDDGRTKQSFKDACDINKILKKAAKVGSLSHLEKHGAHYGDYSDMPDLLEAQERLAAGQAVFRELPSAVRRDFGNDPSRFFAFVNNPANEGKLREILPALAEPGNQLPNVRRSGPSEADIRLSTAEDPSSDPNPSPTPSSEPTAEPASSTT